MENTSEYVLQNRLHALATSGQCQLSLYEEGQAPQGERVRLVWATKATEELIFARLAELNCAAAPLVRRNALSGLELVSKGEGNLSAAFDGIAGLEVLPVTESLPSLRHPGLLVMDMDSTAIKIECIDELAAMAGVGEAVAEVTERAMQGELDFKQSLRQRVAKLAGADAGIIDTLCARLPLMDGLTEMLAELKGHGWKLVVASGGFTPFVGHLKATLGLDAAFANELVIADGKLVGEVTGTVVDANFKADVVSRLGDEYGIKDGQRLAIGDGANDIPMVQRADFGIAFHAKPKLAAAADARIHTLDLRVLPFLLQA
ncbi:phosphoserine phosphatase SerB [Shewanella amazonensis]|uniref:Phosphoserine phosphatase n=1 Tax=Shewanella amazonensis (strain ATCC BAA-1098 / SB2B) TaxID=326297 RepID=A1S479_SHEAM|nr:phosphoserine phosphatase SerB [Shewanella amazonensis]ABL99185.1 phosphoserine phosphatase [Shewanella amazonensis SB2B]